MNPQSLRGGRLNSLLKISPYRPSQYEYHRLIIRNKRAHHLRNQAARLHHYTGCTTDLEQRITDHNRGHVPHTAKFAPWDTEVVIRFRDKTKARAFESYLKSGSGREFARRHF
ncbi:MAG: GIY-YIG nuclease family protein [Kiritimatiellae bacterium]|nr:GIY-YIG nuclease family protein [Kiritimatiellia bacterium]